jgi:hypothetical protein
MTSRQISWVLGGLLFGAIIWIVLRTVAYIQGHNHRLERRHFRLQRPLDHHDRGQPSRLVYAIVRQGSRHRWLYLCGAATQPRASVVTTHVKSLEDRLGVRLLNRTTRSVSLTEAGRAYITSAASRSFRKLKMPTKPPKCFNRRREAFCGSTRLRAFRGVSLRRLQNTATFIRR